MENKKWYRRELDKPLDEIREDIFFRADNFCEEPWYGEFQMFMAIGVCQIKQDHIEDVQKALKIMGHSVRVAEHNGKNWILPAKSHNEKGIGLKPRDGMER